MKSLKSKSGPVSNPAKRTALLRDALFITLGMAAALSLSASAEWKVQDGKLRQVGNDDYREGQEGEAQGKYKKPDVAFKSGDLTIDKATLGTGNAKLSAVPLPIAERCPQPRLPGGEIGAAAQQALNGLISNAANGNATSLQAKQWQVCKEIVETQQARFQYNVVMSELAEKRYDRLKQIREARQRIGNDEAGKLEENNNRMLALIAAVQIDQQQRAAYNDLYNARLAYLEGLQQRLSQKTLDGAPNPAADAIAMAGLAAALDVSPDRLIPN